MEQERRGCYYNEKEEKVIQSTLGRYFDYWNQRDISGIVDIFALDGKFISVIGIVARTHPAIEKLVATMLSSLPGNVSMINRLTEIDFIRKDVATVDSYWQLLIPKGENYDHKELPYREGLGIFIMSKEVKGESTGKSWYIKSVYSSGLVRPRNNKNNRP